MPIKILWSQTVGNEIMPLEDHWIIINGVAACQVQEQHASWHNACMSARPVAALRRQKCYQL